MADVTEERVKELIQERATDIESEIDRVALNATTGKEEIEDRDQEPPEGLPAEDTRATSTKQSCFVPLHTNLCGWPLSQAF